MIVHAYKNWSLIRDFVYRDFKARFAGSVLGVAWNVLHPLVMIAIYILIFSQVMRAKLPGVQSSYGYSVYLCSAIIPWIMFMELLTRYTNIFFEHSNLIKKVSFPREILYVSAMITATINFLISFTIFILFLAVLHFAGKYEASIPFERFLILFAVLGLQHVFCLGLGLTFSCLNVFFRDVGQAVSIASQLWFWFTPIVYTVNVVPDKFRKIIALNPLYHFVKVYRSVIYLKKTPDLTTIAICLVISAGAFIIGRLAFNRLSGEAPDHI